MFESILIAQLYGNPCEGLTAPPMSMSKVCSKRVHRNKKNQLVYKMVTTADRQREITVNRCTWEASPVGWYYQYEPESKWCRNV